MPQDFSDYIVLFIILVCVLLFTGEPDLHDVIIEILLPSQYDCPATIQNSI